MSRVVPIDQDGLRLEAATRWALRIEKGLDADDQRGLKAWLAEHDSHKDVLLEVASVWDKTDSLSRLADLFPHEADSLDVQHQARPALWRRPVTGLAASLVVLVVAGILLLPRMELGFDSARPLVTAVQSAAYETAIGEQKTVLLPDGSEVVLNTNSQLSLMYTSSARVLTLLRGEIHVVVAKDPARPLSVVAGDRIVQAVGTEFSVEITEDQHVEVMVTEGKVVVGIQPKSVRPGSGSTNAQQDPSVIAAAAPVVLPPVLAQLADNTVSAGEELVLGDDGESRKTVSADDIEVKLSWKKGRLIFRSEPLGEVLNEVERYTTVKFVLLDEGLKTRALSGRFRADDVDTFLALLKVHFNIVHEYESESRVLLSSL